MNIEDVLDYIQDLHDRVLELNEENESLRIQLDRPMPADCAARYPQLDTLEVGQSFYLAGQNAPARLNHATQHRTRKLGRAYTVRRHLDQHGNIIGATAYRLK